MTDRRVPIQPKICKFFSLIFSPLKSALYYFWGAAGAFW
ncbi:hypothetical protein CAMRE0001_0397 [Campylobacter rectus RM3267]|uniref:Uncharacterized protein n=1 Tax=Campylobacter rectus RM3267 TaxID=553218 RepID=B9D2G4_CAMRE|nr:hypothetical protein CAMRE0001_0397 [Campylobacter rectus RM3267]